jgi:hypothetical protein
VTEIDQATIIVGLPKHGKTTIARRVALEHLTKYPTGRVLAHDLHQQFVPDLAAAYETIEQWRAAQMDATKPAPRGASFQCSSAEVARLAVELGKRHNKAKDVKLPIALIFDEASLMDTSGPTFMDRLDFQLFANRRHWGLAPVFNVQRQSSLMSAFYEQATDVYIFSQTDENARELERKLSLPKGALAPTVNAPKYRHLHWRQGEGIVAS